MTDIYNLILDLQMRESDIEVYSRVSEGGTVYTLFKAGTNEEIGEIGFHG